MIRLVRMEKVAPAPFTILGWETLELEKSIGKLGDAGVSFLRFPHFQQDAQGIWTSSTGNRIAWFTDPDGNVLSLSQH